MFVRTFINLPHSVGAGYAGRASLLAVKIAHFNAKHNFVRDFRAATRRTLVAAAASPPPGREEQSGQEAGAAGPKAPRLESNLKKINTFQSQLAKVDDPVEQNVAKPTERSLDVRSKKLGWMVSGTAIAIMSAIFGKVYMLFGAVPLFLYHARDLDVLSKTFGRDTSFLWRYSKCWLLAKRIKNENLTLSKVFLQTEKRHPDKIMLQMHDQHWKYKDVASYANRTSRLMQKYGFQKGDVVAMFALNSPEMIAIVLGMANIGIITTLISTELRGAGLAQAILNSGCKGIIFDDELMHAFADVYQQFGKTTIFQMRHKAKQPEFRVLEEELLKEYNDHPEVFINIHHDDPLLYMYSPDDSVFHEPIVITHEKFLFDSSATAMMLDLRPGERIYNPTPLHETTGMILGIGPSITNGVTTILRSKFSATDYFRECYVYNCSVGQYSGTMCKRLLLSPVSPIETFHPVRVMYGTGLESDYWQEFVNRFGTKMLEVHDASKENINLINMEGKIGVVGFRPKLAPSFLFPHFVIKVFGKDNIPVRSSNGLCQLCDYGEPGMLIKLWTDTGNLPPKVKTIQNVFKNGDMAITTGEILTIDENLYLRPLKKHVDKSWMNKLVTSEEVEYIASKLTNKRCAAYSLEMGYKKDVEILAIEDPQKTLDMKKLTDDLVDHLPSNWVPHYVRIVNKLELLPTQLVDKRRLIEQGLNMEGDLVHCFDKNSMCYKPLTWVKGAPPEAGVSEPKIRQPTETHPAPTAYNILSNVNKMAEKLKQIQANETKKKVKTSKAAMDGWLFDEKKVKATVGTAPLSGVSAAPPSEKVPAPEKDKMEEASKPMKTSSIKLTIITAPIARTAEKMKTHPTAPRTKEKKIPTSYISQPATKLAIEVSAPLASCKPDPPIPNSQTASTASDPTTQNVSGQIPPPSSNISSSSDQMLATQSSQSSATLSSPAPSRSGSKLQPDLDNQIPPTTIVKTMKTPSAQVASRQTPKAGPANRPKAVIIPQQSPLITQPIEWFLKEMKTTETSPKVAPKETISTQALAADIAERISRKFKNFAEPVMNKLMKDRLSDGEKVQVPPVTSSRSREDVSVTSHSTYTTLQPLKKADPATVDIKAVSSADKVHSKCEKKAHNLAGQEAQPVEGAQLKAASNATAAQKPDTKDHLQQVQHNENLQLKSSPETAAEQTSEIVEKTNAINKSGGTLGFSTDSSKKPEMNVQITQEVKTDSTKKP